ncbi:MAG: hypothetical protein OER77_14320, partial [Myxococcales bacterium]|nr:hypothetical protein [Myxococcales bacterium]
RRSCLIPWPALRFQFGVDYRRVRDFRRRFVNQLAAVLRVYPGARVSDADEGLLLYPSPPHIQRRCPPPRAPQ